MPSLLFLATNSVFESKNRFPWKGRKAGHFLLLWFCFDEPASISRNTGRIGIAYASDVLAMQSEQNMSYTHNNHLFFTNHTHGMSILTPFRQTHF